MAASPQRSPYVRYPLVFPDSIAVLPPSIVCCHSITVFKPPFLHSSPRHKNCSPPRRQSPLSSPREVSPYLGPARRRYRLGDHASSTSSSTAIPIFTRSSALSLLGTTPPSRVSAPHLARFVKTVIGISLFSNSFVFPAAQNTSDSQSHSLPRLYPPALIAPLSLHGLASFILACCKASRVRRMRFTSSF